MAASSARQLPFTVPKAIKRSPTALLQALANTVGVDKTAPHFAYIDDPTTIPSTDALRQTYWLSKENGKRAARQLAVEWPTLFMFDRDQPRLEAFRPTELPPPPPLSESLQIAKHDGETRQRSYFNEYIVYKINKADLEELDRVYHQLVPRVVGVTRFITYKMMRRLSEAPLRWSLLRRVIEDSIASRGLLNEALAERMMEMLGKVRFSQLNVTEYAQHEALVHRIKAFMHEIEESGLRTRIAEQVEKRARERDAKRVDRDTKRDGQDDARNDKPQS